jgi:hypothetical protein
VGALVLQEEQQQEIVRVSGSRFTRWSEI